MKTQYYLAISLFALASCEPRHQPEQPTRNANSPVIPAPSAPPAVENSPAPQTQPPEPTAKKPTLDPKSTEAAEELVGSFIRLLNTGRLNDAYMLLGPNASPQSESDRQFSHYSDLKVTRGSAGDQEGAAGSIYVSVPLTVSGVLEGKRVIRQATAILRRVNDVPGSTEAQRHWHIERIDWGSGT
ncbi:MAG: hypothetical protein ACTHJK_02585 [Sphingomicrobium sp.]